MSSLSATLAAPASVVTRPAARLSAVDLARGLVILLMALDHTRHLFHATATTADPLDPATTTAALFATRWLTHLCAPVFVLLAGASAWLRLEATGDRPGLSRFLASRGLWLILLELTVVNFAVNFEVTGFGLQVIWALGVAMIALAGLAFLDRRIVLAIGVAIIAGHNLLDPLVPAQFGALAPLWTVLHEGGPIPAARAMVLYPVLPWIGVMALGFGMGPLFARGRRGAFLGLGIAALAGFAILRGFNLYGDTEPWTAQAGPVGDLFAILDVQKYPPSLAYLLATLGLALLLIPMLPRLPAVARGVLETFGRVPLFFYVAHFFLIHGLMTAVGVARGLPGEVFVGVMNDPSRVVAAGWGFGLPVVYGVWFGVLLALYPACRAYGAFKARRRDWPWLSYL